MVLVLAGLALVPGAPRLAAHHVPDEPAVVPRALTLVCEESAARVDSDVVAVQADGLHLTIDNRTGSAIRVVARSGTMDASRRPAPPGISHTTVVVAPPTAYLACLQEGADPRFYSASARAVNPDDVFVGLYPNCTGDYWLRAGDTLPSQRPKWADSYGTREGAARGWLNPWMRPGDVLTRRGLPTSNGRRFFLVRDGRVRAIVEVTKYRGRWYSTNAEMCAELY